MNEHRKATMHESSVFVSSCWETTISSNGPIITKDVVEIEKYKESSSKNVQIYWTINGQIDHKNALIESMQQELQHRRLLFLSYSIGVHMVQRLLVLREDWQDHTTEILYWMHFVRMDPPLWIQ